MGPVTRKAINQILAGQMTGSNSEGDAVLTKPIVDLSQNAPASGKAAGSDDNSSEIQALLAQVAKLNDIITAMKGGQQPTSAPAQATAQTSYSQKSNTASGISPDFSAYAPVTMSLYSADTSAYIGKKIIMTGMVNAVMPRNGSGGSTNYIQIINPFDPAQPNLVLEIDDGSAYTASVTSLQDKSSPILQFVRAYGIGVPGNAFTTSGGATVTVPVVNVMRIDKCIHGSMDTTILTGSTFDENFTCTSWQTIAPKSLATAADSSQPFTTPSGALVDANGNIVNSQQQQPTPTQTVVPQSSNVSNMQTNLPSPWCSLTVSPSSITAGQSAQLSWTSTNATAGSISSIGAVSNMSGTMTVSPSASTSYTGTFSEAGGSTNCSASLAVTQPQQAQVPQTPQPAGKADQTINFFRGIHDVTYGIVGFTIDAMASSGLGVTFTAQGSCSVSNQTGTASAYINSVGSCTVTAHQAGNSNYNPAPHVSQTFTVNSAPASSHTTSMTTYSGTGISPLGIAFDGTNMWTANGDGSVTKLTPSGAPTTYKGSGYYSYGIAFDGTNMWTANYGDQSVTKVSPTGEMTTYKGTGTSPVGIAFDGTNMWTANSSINNVTKVSPTGEMTTYPVGGSGNGPRGIAFDGTNMWTVNNNDNSVIKISPTGVTTIYSGTGSGPFGIAFDGVNMWTANSGDNSVTKVSPTGMMTTYAGTGPGPRGIAFDGTNMWTANYEGNSVTKISPTGVMTTYSGTGANPDSIAFDKANMWVANAGGNGGVGGNSVTKITPAQ